MRISIPLIKTVDESYDIVIAELASMVFDTKVAIVTNPKVAGYHLAAVLGKIKAPEVIVICLPDGESYKTLETITMITDRLFDHRFDRRSVLIALGGGVVGDMTGFAAAIFQRGIDFIQIPTTLLAMVDASVGGKTGINTRFGKNLLGSFNQPRGVYIDPSFLSTLPPREFGAGVAEIVKMAVTFDADFFGWLETHRLDDEANLREAIRRCARIKADVVAQDEKEAGVRAVLNYGHTFGHVIENLAGYGSYLHGEAVAMGIVMANTLACRMGLLGDEDAGRIEKLLASYGLPTRYTVDNPDRFYDLFFLDKKSAQGKIAFILPCGIGGFAIRTDIDEATIKSVLESFELHVLCV